MALHMALHMAMNGRPMMNDNSLVRRIRKLGSVTGVVAGLVVGTMGLPAVAIASCAGMAQAPGVSPHPYFMKASFRNAAIELAQVPPQAPLRAPLQAAPGKPETSAVPKHHMRITFVGHSTFEIETPEGVRAQTDFNDYVQGGRLPHIVTMNNSHDSHFSFAPMKGIEHVLRGWDPKGGIAKHNLMFRDLRVRNVPTNLVDRGEGKFSNGNSMFVFEVAGLCAVHISHLHHYLSKNQLRALGLIDIAFAPIDGMWTMSHDELFRFLGDIKARMVIPMHFGSMGGVEAFVARAQKNWAVRRHPSNAITLSLRDMPKTPEVVFLQGY
ncbi:MAG: L-ascorbate metabolism protein UlaG (beta-lactamase superfamily) [Paracoccaceae bacterium]|jgi:L-ascorbate metabolism protein UlaG (beta-lactamase superfamily)